MLCGRGRTCAPRCLTVTELWNIKKGGRKKKLLRKTTKHSDLHPVSLSNFSSFSSAAVPSPRVFFIAPLSTFSGFGRLHRKGQNDSFDPGELVVNWASSCAQVIDTDGVRKCLASWQQGAMAGKGRRPFGVQTKPWRCRRLPLDLSLHCTSASNRHNIHPSLPAGCHHALSWPCGGAARASRLAADAALGYGRRQKCKRRWSAGKSPGCVGTRPPSLYSG